MLNKTQISAIRCFTTQETPNDERLNAEHLALVDDIENTRSTHVVHLALFQLSKSFLKKAPAVLTEAFSLSNASSADDVGYVNVTLTQSNKVIAIPKGQSILVTLSMKG